MLLQAWSDEEKQGSEEKVPINEIGGIGGQKVERMKKSGYSRNQRTIGGGGFVKGGIST